MIVNQQKNSKLSLGPLFFNWSAQKVGDFYLRIAEEAPVDIVYLGEVVCSKRQPFHIPYLIEVTERLLKSGKQVIFSTLALVMTERELDYIKETVANASGDILIEANDISAASLLSGTPHAIGPFINTYNEGTLKFFERQGATRVSLPSELSLESIKKLAKDATSDLEVQVFGRLPLAISARCYHARANNIHKDNCQFVCENDPDGLVVNTMDNQHFLAINGTQTLSYTYCNLIKEIDLLLDAGISNFRISPHNMDMVNISRIFRNYLDGNITSDEAFAKLKELAGEEVAFSNGFFYGKAGIVGC